MFSKAIDPTETEGEFDAFYEEHLKPHADKMRAERDRVAAMTAEERVTEFQSRMTRMRAAFPDVVDAITNEQKAFLLNLMCAPGPAYA